MLAALHATLLVVFHAMLFMVLLVGLATLYVLLMMGLSATTFHFSVGDCINIGDCLKDCSSYCLQIRCIYRCR